MSYARRAIAALVESEVVRVRGSGNSMTPLIFSGEEVTIIRATPERVALLKCQRDIVLVSKYTHLLFSMSGKGDKVRCKVGNNHGRQNAGTFRIEGIVVMAEDRLLPIFRVLQNAGLLPEELQSLSS